MPLTRPSFPAPAQIFNQAESFGFDMELLDIGGGFTGHFDSHGNVMFGEIANTINSSIAKHFPPETGVRIIAEPGRYFAETAASLLTPVYGQRDRQDAVTGKVRKDYWLTDGLVSGGGCVSVGGYVWGVDRHWGCFCGGPLLLLWPTPCLLEVAFCPALGLSCNGSVLHWMKPLANSHLT